MFPRSFFSTEKQIKSEMTDVPTGMLRNPLDLVSRSRPWVKLSNQALENSPEKKTLVFADHLFKNRNTENREAIYTKLKEAEQQGFKILILSGTGKLVHWERTALDSKYSLSFNQYPIEKIYSEAWAQHSLSADNIFVLDYFGINELLGKDRNTLDSFVFETTHAITSNLFDSTQIENFLLVLESQYAIDQFIESGINTKKITGLHLSSVRLYENAERLFPLLPELSAITLRDCTELSYITPFLGKSNPLQHIKKIDLNDNNQTYHLSLVIMQKTADKLEDLSLTNAQIDADLHVLGKNQFPALRKFNFTRADITPAGLLVLIEAAPNLNDIDLSVCWRLSKINFTKNSLTHLKKANFHGSQLSAESLISFLMAAPDIESLNLCESLGIQGAFENTQPNQLKNLKYINLIGTPLSEADVLALSKAAPNLEHILMERCQYSLFAIHSLPSECFKKLITFDGHTETKTMEANDLSALLKRATELEYLTIPGDSAAYETFQELRPQQLKKLKKLELSASSGKTYDLTNLVSATPNLEKLDLTASGPLTIDIKKASNGWMKLKEVNLRLSKINQENFIALLTAAPNLTEIDISDCGNLEITLDTIRKAPLTKLKKISLNNAYIAMPQYSRKSLRVVYSTFVTLEAYIEMLKVTAGLEEINLSYIMGSPDLDFDEIFSITHEKLQKISLHHDSFSIDSLFNIFQKTPNLETLDLDGSIISEETQGWSAIPMPYLKKLQLRSCNAQSNTIVFILFIARNVEEINFKQCKNAFEAVAILRAGLLPALENIWVDESISIKTIRDFQRAAPNLKMINGKPVADIDKIELANHVYNQTNQILEATSVDNSFFDTASDNQTLTYVNYFPNVKPLRYRLSISKPNLNSLIVYNAFPPDDFKSIPFEHKNYVKESNYHCEEGVRTVTKQEGKTILLPSLDAEEKIFNLQIVDGKGRLITLDECQIQFSGSSQFHRIILPKSGNFTIHFQVAIPDKPQLPLNLVAMVNDYNTFKESTENPEISFPNLHEGAKYIRKHRVGRCELRAVAGYQELLDSTLSYKHSTRIVANDIHAYLEVNANGRWHKLDLGGYNANLNEIKQNKTEISVENEIIEKANKQAEMTSHELQTLIAKIQTATLSKETNPTQRQINTVENSSDAILVLGESDFAFQKFYRELCHDDSKLTHTIFIARRPEDIALSGYSISASGNVTPGHTALKKWLDDRDTGIIVVDMREFNASAIAQLNDLLDRRIEDKKISPHIRIILLNKPNAHSYGEDFLRRTPHKIILPNPANAELLKNANTAEPQRDPADKPRDVGIISEEFFEIDLYQSPYWQRLLTGIWKLEKTADDPDFSFYWDEGKLLKILHDLKNSTKHIIFKNPPLNDPTFTDFITELQGLKRIPWADQLTTISDDMHFSKTQGYSWEKLRKQTLLDVITNESKPYILSDTNLLSFVEDRRYEFSKNNHELQAKNSYFKECEKIGFIEVICEPSLSEDVLAEFLTVASAKHLKVRFLVPSLTKIPASSPLQRLNLNTEAIKSFESYACPIQWELHDDVNFAARKILNARPFSTRFDMSYLDASELGHIPISAEHIRKKLLATSKFSMTARVSDIISKLKNTDPIETIILTGKVPPALYAALTELSLGQIDKQRFPGKLIILTPPEEAPLAEALTGKTLSPIFTTTTDKIALLEKVLSREAYTKNTFATFISTFAANATSKSFTELEREFLQQQLNAEIMHYRLDPNTHKDLTDEELSDSFDRIRIDSVHAALAINPWVMIEGPTGIGKTHFLKKVLAHHHRTFFDIDEYLANRDPHHENIIVIDEASFLSQLSGQGDNALERFKNFKNKGVNSPGFLWKGVYHQCPKDKVIFAFNPASYGAGRSTQNILSDEALSISFQRLPPFYLRARIIKPIIENIFGKTTLPFDKIANPIISVYNWILKKNPETALITPREIKAMVNIVANKMIAQHIDDPKVIEDLATEVAFEIGKQVLNDNAGLLNEFEACAFKPTRFVIKRSRPPEAYLPHQYHAYGLIQTILQTRQNILSPHKNTDLGLGGFLLEGGSGIGKSDFIQKISAEVQATGKKIYAIPSTASFEIKEEILRQAFAEGALVIAEEFNTSLWPHKLLNNYLMGLDEQGNEASTPGFFLLATQNPPSFAGRAKEDPAMRHRLFKLNLDWPVYQAPVLEKSVTLVTMPPPEVIQSIETAAGTHHFKLLCLQKYKDICIYLSTHNPLQNYTPLLFALDKFISQLPASDSQFNLLIHNLELYQTLNPELKTMNALLKTAAFHALDIAKIFDLSLQLFETPSDLNKTRYFAQISSLLPSLTQENSIKVMEMLATTLQNLSTVSVSKMGLFNSSQQTSLLPNPATKPLQIKR